jgi:hypothetical protein
MTAASSRVTEPPADILFRLKVRLIPAVREVQVTPTWEVEQQ